jgi:hypothetical protein
VPYIITNIKSFETNDKTDIRKLKSRYSIFGNPDVLCYFSNDINTDENVLKKMMRDAGCMESNKEMISNVPMAREVFYEFIEMTRVS